MGSRLSGPSADYRSARAPRSSTATGTTAAPRTRYSSRHQYSLSRESGRTLGGHTIAVPGGQSTTSFRHTGNLWCVRYTGEFVSSTRTAGQVKDVFGDSVYLGMLIEGEYTCSHVGRTVTVMPGQAVALRNDHPFEVLVQSRWIDAITIAIPMDLLRVWNVDVTEIVARPWDLSGLAVQARDFVAEVIVEDSGDALPEILRLDEILVRMALLVISSRESFELPAPGLLNIRRAVIDAIEIGAANPELSCTSIANGLHTSVRTLHRAFEGTGLSVTGLIMQKRLERAAMELAYDDRRRTIAAVAHANGFRGADQLTRNFKRQYGMTPVEFRDTWAGGTDPTQ